MLLAGTRLVELGDRRPRALWGASHLVDRTASAPLPRDDAPHYIPGEPAGEPAILGRG